MKNNNYKVMQPVFRAEMQTFRRDLGYYARLCLRRLYLYDARTLKSKRKITCKTV